VSLPDGYDAVDATGVSAFAVASAVDWLEETVRGGETLYGWAERLPDRGQLSGRGVVYSVPAPSSGPDGRARWAVRHYRRGGVAARLLVDRYLAVGERRPHREAAAAAALRERGIPTPAVVAGATYGDGLFYRADLVTELVPGAADLAEVVFGSGGHREQALRVAGRLVALLGRAGVEHADLNAKNILLAETDQGARAYVLDLDRCTVGTAGATAGASPMRRRLERSLRKLEDRAGRTLTTAEWAALRDGVESRSR